MFNTTHILYMIVSALISGGVVTALCLLKNKTLNKISIWILAIGTVVIHFSGLWYEYFTAGSALVSMEYLLPAFPCHICMWLLVIAATLLEKDGVIARLIKDFAFWGGTVCGSFGLILNENFAKNPTLDNYYVFKGLLSHSTMILGCILILSCGYIKVGVKRSCAAVFSGLMLFGLEGAMVNGLFTKYELGQFNAMYMQYPPFENLPFINVYTIGLASMTVVFIASVLYEFFALPKEERWYYPLFKKRIEKSEKKPQH